MKDGEPPTIIPFRRPPQADRLALVWYEQIEPILDAKSLIEDFLSPGTFSVLYGESGSGKTFLALDMALHIAHGFDWFGRRTMQGAVIYIAAEAGKQIYNRVVAFKLEHDSDASDGRVPFAAIPCSVDLLHPEADLSELISRILEVEAQIGMPVVMIVVDTLSRSMAGGEENSSEDMGQFVRNLDALRETTSAHVMVVHHCGKDAARGARGHSLLRAAADHEFEVTHDKATGARQLTVSKQRDMPTGGTIAFRLHPVTLGESPEGKSVTSFSVKISDEEPKKSRKPLSGVSAIALEKLNDFAVDHGQPAPGSNHIPQNVTVISLEAFRAHLRDTGVTEEKGSSNERQAWKRIRENLLSNNIIAIWKDWLWKIP